MTIKKTGTVNAKLSEATKKLHNRTINENAILNMEWFHELPKQAKLALVMRIKPFHYSCITHEDLVEVFKNDIEKYL